MTAKEIAGKLPITEGEKEAIANLLELSFREGYQKARDEAISAFDTMWLGDDEENFESYEMEPDYDYHRQNFIKVFMW